MKVRMIIWDEIPKEAWVDILEMIDYGDYIGNLPYKFPEGLNRVRVPLRPLSLLATALDPAYPEMPYLTFERVRAYSPKNHKASYIWKRIIG